MDKSCAGRIFSRLLFVSHWCSIYICDSIVVQISKPNRVKNQVYTLNLFFSFLPHSKYIERMALFSIYFHRLKWINMKSVNGRNWREKPNQIKSSMVAGGCSIWNKKKFKFKYSLRSRKVSSIGFKYFGGKEREREGGGGIFCQPLTPKGSGVLWTASQCENIFIFFSAHSKKLGIEIEHQGRRNMENGMKKNYALVFSFFVRCLIPHWLIGIIIIMKRKRAIVRMSVRENVQALGERGKRIRPMMMNEWISSKWMDWCVK